MGGKWELCSELNVKSSCPELGRAGGSGQEQQRLLQSSGLRELHPGVSAANTGLVWAFYC